MKDLCDKINALSEGDKEFLLAVMRVKEQTDMSLKDLIIDVAIWLSMKIDEEVYDERNNP